MGLLSKIRGLFNRPARTVAKPAGKERPSVRGRYDAARNAPENAEYWASADALSANAANNPVVRNTLRNRSRYEAQNNGYCKGLIRGRRNDLIGTGPRLQLTLPDTWTETYEDPDFGVEQQREVTTPAGAARQVERLFRKWMDAADIAQDLRVMSETTDRDGETFAVLVTNPGVDGAVKLDLRLYEAEECSTPDLLWNDPLRIDGIVFDAHLNPVEYHFLKRHPGDNGWLPTWEYDRVPANHVIHWFVTRAPDSELLYKCSDIYAPACDGAVRFDDPDLRIDWGIDPATAILSDKDRAAPFMAQFSSPFTSEARA